MLRYGLFKTIRSYHFGRVKTALDTLVRFKPNCMLTFTYLVEAIYPTPIKNMVWGFSP